jgi:hypothetical protein
MIWFTYLLLLYFPHFWHQILQRFHIFCFFVFLKNVDKTLVDISFMYLEIIWESLEKFLVNMCFLFLNLLGGQFPICVVVSEKNVLLILLSLLLTDIYLG